MTGRAVPDAKLCASRYFFLIVAARMSLTVWLPPFHESAGKRHGFIVVRKIIAAQRRLRDEHHTVPYIQWMKLA
ncbi:hypothetical protein CWD78_19095 [Dickeya dadantii]|nr:hypothetical protein [Dickeya dadantii]